MDTIMINTHGTRRWCVVLAMAATAWAGGASAMSSCEGTYAASLLQPLPAQIVAGLEVRDRPPASQQLADRFLAGLRAAGVTVGAQPNVVLHISTSRIGGTPARPGPGEEQNYPDIAGLQGGIPLSLPEMPGARITERPGSPVPPLLLLRVEATEGQAAHISWIASVMCRITGNDNGQRAQDLGKIIGGALGRRVERGPL